MGRPYYLTKPVVSEDKCIHGMPKDQCGYCNKTQTKKKAEYQEKKYKASAKYQDIQLSSNAKRGGEPIEDWEIKRFLQETVEYCPNRKQLRKLAKEFQRTTTAMVWWWFNMYKPDPEDPNHHAKAIQLRFMEHRLKFGL